MPLTLLLPFVGLFITRVMLKCQTVTKKAQRRSGRDEAPPGTGPRVTAYETAQLAARWPSLGGEAAYSPA